MRPISLPMFKSHGVALLGCALLAAGGVTPVWGWLLMSSGAVLLIISGAVFLKGRAK